VSADPHIHVDRKLGADVAARGILASTFGLAADVPAAVTTGCGRQAPLAMTSTHPEKVTCLPCRDFAHGQHLRLADQLELLGAMPGSVITPEQTAAAAALHRDLAGRYGDPAR
jgi:hypothetical protein